MKTRVQKIISSLFQQKKRLYHSTPLQITDLAHPLNPLLKHIPPRLRELHEVRLDKSELKLITYISWQTTKSKPRVSEVSHAAILNCKWLSQSKVTPALGTLLDLKILTKRICPVRGDSHYSIAHEYYDHQEYESK